MPLDVSKIRADFPILSAQIYNKPLIYLDNGATTQKPSCVINKIDELYSTTNANIHRGVHLLSQQATELSEHARKTIQQFINAKQTHEIIFTKGTTESINLVASSFCQKYCSKGDEIILTSMEHHSNIVPWQIQAELKGLHIKVVPINNKGELLVEEIHKLITNKTKLISLTHVSNVLGTINPIEQIINTAHQQNIPVLIDAAQSIQHLEVDVQKLDCDFLVFSGHKIYGPTGTGILYAKEKLLDDMPPYQGGGEMIDRVSFKKTTYNALPFKFEAGTPNYIDLIALGTAIEYIQSIGLKAIKEYEDELLIYSTQKLLSEIKGVTIYGTADAKSSALSFLVEGIHHYDMGMLLDKMGIAVRTGHHCAQPLMETLGIEGTVRATFAFYNTKDEIDFFIESLKRVCNMLR